MNLRPLGYEPNELPGCSTPHFKSSNVSAWRSTKCPTIQRFRNHSREESNCVFGAGKTIHVLPVPRRRHPNVAGRRRRGCNRAEHCRRLLSKANPPLAGHRLGVVSHHVAASDRHRTGRHPGDGRPLHVRPDDWLAPCGGALPLPRRTWERQWHTRGPGSRWKPAPPSKQ